MSSSPPLPGSDVVDPVAKMVSLTSLEHTGVIIMALAGVLSCLLVSTLLISITYTALSSHFRKSPEVAPPFTSRQIAVFVVCLLVSDLIQSISGITQIRWAAEKRLHEGQACSVQAATLVMGDLGSTVWSSVIAAHTFCGLALGKQWSKRTVYAVVILGWGFVTILTLIGPLVITRPEKGPFFSIAGTWCFISSEYAISRLLLHYVPLFIASGLIVVLYGLVFLVLRGTISFTQNVPHSTALPLNDMFSRQRVMIAKRMLWYPIAYLTAILPIAVIRIIGLKEAEVPEGAWILGMFFLFSLGAVDAIIYATTRHVVKPLTIHVRPISTSRMTNTNTNTQTNTLTTPSSAAHKDSFVSGNTGSVPSIPSMPYSYPCSYDIESGVVSTPSLQYTFPGSFEKNNGSVGSLGLLDGVQVTTEQIREVI